MPKRKLLSEISKRHYRRLKCSTRNITLAENINNKLSIDFANIDALQSDSSDTSSNLDQTNITLRNELSQQCINTSNKENVHDLHYDNIDLKDLVYPNTFIMA